MSDDAKAGPGSLASAAMPLAMLALAMATGFAAMGSFSTVQEGAKAELHLSDDMLALIQGLGAAVPLALFSIPIGILVDRFRRTRLLLALAGLWTVGTALTAIAPSIGVLILARMMTGIGTTGALTAALSIAADLCRPEERGRALLIVTLGKTAGVAAAFALVGVLFGMAASGGALARWWTGVPPWRSAHAALALLAALLFVPLLTLREPARRESQAGPHAPFRVVAAELWARRRFLLPLFVGQVGVVMADAAAGVWASPVLSRGFAQRPEQFAGWMGAVLLGAGIAGTVIGGLLADAGQRSGRRSGLLLGAVAAAVVGVPAALFPIAPGVPVFAVALGTLILAGTVTGLITSVALTVFIPNELRGLCIGAFIALAGVIGFGLAPALVTRVSALLGGEAHLASALAVVGVVTGALSAGAFALAARRTPPLATGLP